MHTIGVVARQTGIATDTLRKWELRYGFPVAARSPAGRRLYSNDEVAALHEVARDIAGGASTRAAIQQRAQRLRADKAPENRKDPVHKALVMLQKHDMLRYEQFVGLMLSKHSMEGFVYGFALPLTIRVGQEWQAGRLPVFAEHAFASHMQTAVAQHLMSLRDTRTRSAPRILLALPAGETHRLALVLLEAVLEDAGVPCIALHDPLAAQELARAARAYRVSVVAVSCSAAGSARLLQGELKALRDALPRRVKLWAGGAGAQLFSQALAGVEVMNSMPEAVRRLQDMAPARPAARRSGRAT